MHRESVEAAPHWWKPIQEALEESRRARIQRSRDEFMALVHERYPKT